MWKELGLCEGKQTTAEWTNSLKNLNFTQSLCEMYCFVCPHTRVIYSFYSSASQPLVPRTKTKWTTVNMCQCFASCHVDAHTCPQLAAYEEERNSNKRHPGFQNEIQLCEAILCHSNKSVFMWVNRKGNFVRLVFTFKYSRIYIIYLTFRHRASSM